MTTTIKGKHLHYEDDPDTCTELCEPEPGTQPLFFDIQDSERVTWVTVVNTEPSWHPRWFAGEPGILLLNDYSEKYDAKVLLGPEYGPYERSWYETPPPFLAGLLGVDRIFYFYAEDLVYRSGPGYGRWKP